jgi:GTP-binding protein HflX
VPALDVFNKWDMLDDAARTRLRAVYPGALCVSALTGEGREDLVSAMESRLALDTARVTFEFSATSEEARTRIAQLYRVGRVLQHIAADGRISIEAELPRRLIAQFGAVAQVVS